MVASMGLRARFIMPFGQMRSMTSCSRPLTVFSYQLRLRQPMSCLRLTPSRANSSVPQKKSKIEEPPIQIDKTTLHRIPGESVQSNKLIDRIPKFPLSKEAVPTLLPRPGVPMVGPNMPFRKMVEILESKSEPELIYEAEPHRLYFVFCACFALVFAVYGINVLTIGMELAWSTFDKNELALPMAPKVVNFIVQSLLTIGLACFPLGFALLFVYTPTRLVRRLWYIPGSKGEKPLVQILTHPLVPSRPSPIISIPVENLNRAQTSKVWTGRGFYGTVDSTIFFFLRETGRRFPWIVDRKGFFWGDGRIHDYLFGKETIEEAEKGLSYDQKIGIMNQRKKAGEEKLKKELGVGWRYKAQAKLLKEDISKLKKIVKQVPGSKSERKKLK
ncbi:hypothetical protein LJB42_003439 [Komagataella kurtzmanii]|nr:hypothetical protein LJB42_003439 [Komagataella kurtzmanii]